VRRTVNGEDGKLLRLTEHFVGEIYCGKVRSVPIKPVQRRRQQTLAFIDSDKFLKKIKSKYLWRGETIGTERELLIRVVKERLREVLR
jgi:hypothetical protein